MLFIAVLCTEGSHTTSNILSSNRMSSLHLVADTCREPKRKWKFIYSTLCLLSSQMDQAYRVSKFLSLLKDEGAWVLSTNNNTFHVCPPKMSSKSSIATDSLDHKPDGELHCFYFLFTNLILLIDRLDENNHIRI